MSGRKTETVLRGTSQKFPIGAGLVREIRKSPELAKIPVYVITADVEMQGEYKGKGFDNMLLKPLTIDKLQNLLAQYAPHED